MLPCTSSSGCCWRGNVLGDFFFWFVARPVKLDYSFKTYNCVTTHLIWLSSVKRISILPKMGNFSNNQSIQLRSAQAKQQLQSKIKQLLTPTHYEARIRSFQWSMTWGNIETSEKASHIFKISLKILNKSSAAFTVASVFHSQFNVFHLLHFFYQI